MNCSTRVALLLSVALGLAGCGSGTQTQGLGLLGTRFGQPCSLGLPDAGDPSTLTVNPSAPECPSRVCVFPVEEKSVGGTGPFCTAGCSGDADCAGGETRSPGASAAADPRCATGFACRILVPKLASNPLACVPVCVCKDFLSNVVRTADGCAPLTGK